MNAPSYSASGYRNKVRSTNNRVLLVEGKDDRRAFQCLIDELASAGVKAPERFIIDTADIIRGGDAANLGNRERIESVCFGMEESDDANKIVGFVDREFRDFDIPTMSDLLQDHKLVGRMVWSRGHSIENYYFDPQLFRRCIRSVSVSRGFEEATKIFEKVFLSIIRTACAVGLTGMSLNKLSLISGSVHWTAFSLTNNGLHFDPTVWGNFLLRKKRCNEVIVGEIIKYYTQFLHLTSGADPIVLRWLCHGHLGIAVLWSAYARCVFEVTGDASDAEQVLDASVDVRFNSCADAWAHAATENRAIFPRVALDMLGFNVEIQRDVLHR